MRLPPPSARLLFAQAGAEGIEAVTFGYPRVARVLNSGPEETFGYPRQAPCLNGDRRPRCANAAEIILFLLSQFLKANHSALTLLASATSTVGDFAVLLFPWYPAMMLALEASNVIDMRLWKIGRGGHEAATESHLTVKEKIDAIFEASSVLVDSGNPAVIEIYRKHVAANAARLAEPSYQSGP